MGSAALTAVKSLPKVKLFFFYICSSTNKGGREEGRSRGRKIKKMEKKNREEGRKK